MDYKLKDYTITNARGQKIAGRLYAPVGAGPHKTVIFAHGFSGNYRELEDYGPKFAEKHIAMFLFDFCGGGNDVYSDGSTEEMSVLTELEDFQCVYEFVKGLIEVDEKNIYFMGASQGAYVAALCASRYPQEAKGLVLWYPAFCIADDFRKKLDEELDYIPKVWEMKLGEIYTKDILSIDIYEEIKSYKEKVLIFHGDSDEVVPIYYSERALKYFQDAELIVFSGEGHEFSKNQRVRAKEIACDFILKESGDEPDESLPAGKEEALDAKKNIDSKEDEEESSNKTSFWDRAAGLYDVFENLYNGRVNRELCIEVAKLIDDTDVVLECACGTGMITKSVAKIAAKVTATDFSIGMLNKAQKNLAEYKNVKLKTSNIMSLKSSDEKYDKVIAGNVIHLLDDPKSAVNELLRVCKTGGKVIIPTYVNNDSTKEVGIFIKVIENCGAGFKCQFDFESYKAFFTEMGFDNIEFKLVSGKMPCAIAIIQK